MKGRNFYLDFINGKKLEEIISCPRLECQEVIKLGIEPESPDSKIHTLYHMILHCQLELPKSISGAALDLTVGRVKVSVVQAPSNKGERQLNFEAANKIRWKIFSLGGISEKL